MAEESEAIITLITAREKLVEERRALSVAMALGYRRRRTDDSHTNDMRETFIGIQNTIEAIDRAIVQEKLLVSGQPNLPTAQTLGAGPPRASQFDNRQ